MYERGPFCNASVFARSWFNSIQQNKRTTSRTDDRLTRLRRWRLLSRCNYSQKSAQGSNSVSSGLLTVTDTISGSKQLLFSSIMELLQAAIIVRPEHAKTIFNSNHNLFIFYESSLPQLDFWQCFIFGRLSLQPWFPLYTITELGCPDLHLKTKIT